MACRKTEFWKSCWNEMRSESLQMGVLPERIRSSWKKHSHSQWFLHSGRLYSTSTSPCFPLTQPHHGGSWAVARAVYEATQSFSGTLSPPGSAQRKRTLWLGEQWSLTLQGRSSDHRDSTLGILVWVWFTFVSRMSQSVHTLVILHLIRVVCVYITCVCAYLYIMLSAFQHVFFRLYLLAFHIAFQNSCW